MYQPGERGINHVRVIVTEAGCADPTAHQVNAAWIDLGAPVGATVGEVAEHLIERGKALTRSGQGTLFA